MKRVPLKRKGLRTSGFKGKLTVAKSLKPKKGKVSKPKLSLLKRKLDAIFSKYIRARDGHTCYTCDIRLDPTRSQNGHFVPRQYLSLRWDEINCHCQCYACNVLYNGQPSAYATRLKADYGEGILEVLENARKKVTKLTPEWYEEQLKIFSEKLAELEAEAPGPI